MITHDLFFILFTVIVFYGNDGLFINHIQILLLLAPSIAI